jgi:hypothetical protein
VSTTTLESIVSYFEKEHGVVLSKMRRKKIIFEGRTKDHSSIVVAMPASTIYSRGNGWVDFTKIQIDIFKQYKIAIAVFRLSDGSTSYVDMKRLFPLLNQNNMMENSREGEHWKLDIWPNKIVIRNGGEVLHVRPNEKSFIKQLLKHASV